MTNPAKELLINRPMFRLISDSTPKKEWRNGDIIVDKNNMTQFFDGHEWIPLGNLDDNKEPEHRIIENIKCTCERCGAPMHITETMIRLGVAQCEYCECSQSLYE